MVKPVACLLLLVVFRNVAFSAPAVRLAPVVSGLVNPVYVTHSGDQTSRLFIVEQAGRILIHHNEVLLSPPFLDIRDKVNSGGEKGLLGLAFHPDFRNNRRFFVNYTRLDGSQLRTIIAEYQASLSDANRAEGTEKVLLEVNQPFSNHNGGHLAFGPDGFLYVALGDGGSGGDPQGNAQNLGALLGKILRIDVNESVPYAIPPNNPFARTAGARPEIWAYGLRNPWRFSFDKEGGRLFAADVGQNSWEEIDLIVRGGNYGWNIMEGAHCFPSTTSCNRAGLILPISEYGRSEGISVTGGYVYRGTQNTELRGKYIFGDYGSGRIWALEQRPSGEWNRTELLRAGFPISSFGEDEAGEIYVADHSGAIFKMQMRTRRLLPQVGDGTTAAGVFTTSLLLVNTLEQEIEVEAQFYRSDGSPLAVSIEGSLDSRFLFRLKPRSSRVFRTAGHLEPAVAGWAELTADQPFTAAVLFAMVSSSGEAISEAGVDASEMTRRILASVSRKSAFDTNTGAAFANPSVSDAVRVDCVVRNQEGVTVANQSFTLGPRNHRAFFISELGVPEDFEGTFEASSSREFVATLLRTSRGIHLSSLPVSSY
ncbi:MAG: PQQ-dependent sugar dehydrogenase [Acidobacteria bacterium]|nr:PQQ-dependent sugar dehydrogenase [Acidobacteriota bacterium]